MGVAPACEHRSWAVFEKTISYLLHVPKTSVVQPYSKLGTRASLYRSVECLRASAGASFEHLSTPNVVGFRVLKFRHGVAAFLRTS